MYRLYCDHFLILDYGSTAYGRYIWLWSAQKGNEVHVLADDASVVSAYVLLFFFSLHIRIIRYFQHAHFIPIVGVEKREAYINWSMVTCQGISTRSELP